MAHVTAAVKEHDEAVEHVIAFPSALVRIDGALELRETPRGLVPRRLPAWTAPQLPERLLDMAVAATAGVRIVFRTSATALALDLHATRIAVPDTVLPAAVDLLVDGRFAARTPLTGGDVERVVSAAGEVVVEPGPAETVTFTGLAGHAKQVQLWLPQTAGCALVALTADAPILAATPDTAPRWVHHGSSISQCVEAPGPTETWPALAARATGWAHTNLGFAGNAMLDPFVARTLRDTPAELISLKLGVNLVGDAAMTARTFRPAVHGFLDTIRDGHPATAVVVVSPIACPALATPPGELGIDAVRAALAEIVAARADPNLSYLDGRELLDSPEDLYDGLHPRPAAHARMADRFAAILRRYPADQGADVAS